MMLSTSVIINEVAHMLLVGVMKRRRRRSWPLMTAQEWDCHHCR